MTLDFFPADNVDQENDCICQPFSTCAWSKHLVDQISVLPETHPVRKSLSQQFRAQICNTANRKVWCCRNGEFATEAELKQLTHINDSFSGKSLAENNIIKQNLSNKGVSLRNVQTFCKHLPLKYEDNYLDFLVIIFCLDQLLGLKIPKMFTKVGALADIHAPISGPVLS